MQLSAANLIIASQQLARGAAAAAPEAGAQFTAALAKEKGVEAPGFAPMDFKQAVPARTPAPAAPAAPAAGYNPGGRIGATIDIRV